MFRYFAGIIIGFFLCASMPVVQAQIAERLSKTVRKKITNAARTTYENYLVGNFCPQYEAAFDLAPGSCTLDDIKSNGCLKTCWRDNNDDPPVEELWIGNRFSRDGNWTPDP